LPAEPFGDAQVRAGQPEALFRIDPEAFAGVLRDPDSPSKILAVYDSGDHGHANDAGYKALADIIDLRLF
jgi:hypothetical protein